MEGLLGHTKIVKKRLGFVRIKKCVHMSVTMEKPAEQDVVAEKVKSIVDCYITRKKAVMTTTSAPVVEADEGYDTIH